MKHKQFHNGRVNRRGESSRQGQTHSSISQKRRNRGGKGSKDRRRKDRVGKTEEYLRAKEQLRREADRAAELALEILRDLEIERKSEALNVRKHEEIVPPVEKLQHPTETLTEQRTDKGVVSSVLKEVYDYNDSEFDYDDVDVIYENCHLQKVFSETSNIIKECQMLEQRDKDNEKQRKDDEEQRTENEYNQLERTCWNTYYREKPDNNIKKLRRLGKTKVVNKHGFSQDNYYLLNYYNAQKENEDEHQHNILIEQQRNDATVRYEDNQTQARQNERETENPVEKLLRQSIKEQNEQTQRNKKFVEDQIKKKRKITR